MAPFWATFYKEFLLLRRDRSGLLTLFVMPTVLVIIVALVQNNILESSGSDGLKILYLDQDYDLQGNSLGSRIQQELERAGLELVAPPQNDVATLRQHVATGQYPLGVVIPAGISAKLRDQARLSARALFDGNASAQEDAVPLSVELYFDPTVQGALRSSIVNALRLATFAVETEYRWDALAQLWQQQNLQMLPATLNPQQTLRVVEHTASVAAKNIPPSAVQHNVPAWALFGMFFSALPLAGTLLNERQNGTLQRLRTFALSPLWLLSGKIAAYFTVCLL